MKKENKKKNDKDLTTEELILKVADGNPGAMTVIKTLMYYNKWYLMMRLLLNAKITGSKLWELYKDTHKMSDRALARDLEDKIERKRLIVDNPNVANTDNINIFN